MAVTPRYLPAPSEFTGVKSGGGNGERLKFLIRPVDAPRSNPMAIRVKLDPGMPLGVLESASYKLMVTEPKRVTTASRWLQVRSRQIVISCWNGRSNLWPNLNPLCSSRKGTARPIYWR